MPYNRFELKNIDRGAVLMQNWERLKDIKCFLFDMDGTINLGNTLIAGMDEFFGQLKAKGKTFYLVTNNSSKDHAHYVKKMSKMGIEVEQKDVLISSDALTYYLGKASPKAKLFVLGTPELKGTITKAGFELVDPSVTEPEFVILGFDMTLAYDNLSTACRLIDKGIPYIATHPDVRCPIENGEFIPDCGAMIELIKTATGISPLDVLGKPYHYMIDLLMERTGFKKNEIAMVGDRLSTDIAFGLNNNILSVLVLTGEATLEDVERGHIKPDIILDHAANLINYI